MKSGVWVRVRSQMDHCMDASGSTKATGLIPDIESETLFNLEIGT